MRSLLQFIGVWGAWIGVSAGALSIAIWALSFDDDPSDEQVASSLLWSMFWPFIWIYLWLTGKNSVPVSRRTVRPNGSKMKSQIGMRGQNENRFRSVREAKEYLVGVIAKEAENTGTPLTEVERKMLYFTETGWTLPDMKEVSSEFDRNCDQDKYEDKIASIVARIDARLAQERQDGRMAWDRALEKLSEGDHYLLVLVNAATPHRKAVRHNLKILIIAVLFFVLAAVNFWFRKWLWNHS